MAIEHLRILNIVSLLLISYTFWLIGRAFGKAQVNLQNIAARLDESEKQNELLKVRLAAEIAKSEGKNWFRNYYDCARCNYQWIDEWSAKCDDRCPVCNTAISPYNSEDLGVT